MLRVGAKTQAFRLGIQHRLWHPKNLPICLQQIFMIINYINPFLFLGSKLKKEAWGYVPSKGIKDLILRIVGHPHPNGRIRAKIVRSFLENKKTVDLGCGEGIFCFELKKRGYDITGVDTSREALIHAKENFKKLELDIDVINASANKTPFKEKSFGQVICLDVLEHVNDPSKVLKEINRLLIKKGTLIITVPNELYLFKTIIPYDFSGILKEIGHKHPGFDLPKIKDLLNNNGFKIISYRYYHKFFSRLTSEISFALIGEKRFKKSRKKMYEHSILAMLSFIIIYTINMLDFLLPKKSKGGFVAVKAEKI